jgi:hypothetical protein
LQPEQAVDVDDHEGGQANGKPAGYRYMVHQADQPPHRRQNQESFETAALSRGEQPIGKM